MQTHSGDQLCTVVQLLVLLWSQWQDFLSLTVMALVVIASKIVLASVRGSGDQREEPSPEMLSKQATADEC